jgi:hypothetical protein
MSYGLFFVGDAKLALDARVDPNVFDWTIDGEEPAFSVTGDAMTVKELLDGWGKNRVRSEIGGGGRIKLAGWIDEDQFRDCGVELLALCRAGGGSAFFVQDVGDFGYLWKKGELSEMTPRECGAALGDRRIKAYWEAMAEEQPKTKLPAPKARKPKAAPPSKPKPKANLDGKEWEAQIAAVKEILAGPAKQAYDRLAPYLERTLAKKTGQDQADWIVFQLWQERRQVYKADERWFAKIEPIARLLLAETQTQRTIPFTAVQLFGTVQEKRAVPLLIALIGHLVVDELCPAMQAIGDARFVAPLRKHMKTLASTRERRLVEETIDALSGVKGEAARRR